MKLAVLLSLPLALAAPAAGAQSYKSDAAGRAVVRDYYAAIDRRAYRTAFAAWGGASAAGKSYARFVRGFARTAHTRVVLGASPPSEGGAGSIYLTVPVEVRATLKDGRHQRFTGSYVVRRVNDVPGATPRQLRWHITSATLRQR